MASPLYCELSVAKTQATEFLFHASESAFALQTRNLVLVPDWALETRHRRDSRREWHVRFGSKADMCSAKVMSALPPIADMCSATRRVCFGPLAEGVTHCVAANELADHALLIRPTGSLDI